jgi:hypothetical protein
MPSGSRDFVNICGDFDFRELPLNNAHVMAGGFRQPFDEYLQRRQSLRHFFWSRMTT